jgi:hypothetical protein
MEIHDEKNIILTVVAFSSLVFYAHADQEKLKQICLEAATSSIDTPSATIMNPPILKQAQGTIFVSRRLVDPDKHAWGIQRLDKELTEWFYTSEARIQDFLVTDTSIWVLFLNI